MGVISTGKGVARVKSKCLKDTAYSKTRRLGYKVARGEKVGRTRHRVCSKEHKEDPRKQSQ